MIVAIMITNTKHPYFYFYLRIIQKVNCNFSHEFKFYVDRSITHIQSLYLRNHKSLITVAQEYSVLFSPLPVDEIILNTTTNK